MIHKNVSLTINLWLIFIALATACGCLGCGSALAGEKHAEELDWTLDGAGVSKIDVKAINGEIVLEGSDRTDVVVHAFKEVRARDASVLDWFSNKNVDEFAKQVKIHVERKRDEVRVYVKHPKKPKNIRIAVRYEIQCPSTVDANLFTDDANIRVSGIHGVIDATTDDGSIEVRGGKNRLKQSYQRMGFREILRSRCQRRWRPGRIGNAQRLNSG